jgi:YHS domain-containing protein
MTKRPTYTARGWLYCAATGLLLISPQFVQAQTPTAQPSAARPATTAKKSNPLFSAVKRELSKLKGSKKPQQPGTTQKKPGLLPVFGPSPSNRVGTTKRQTAVQPAYRKQRGVHSGARLQPIQQTAGNQPAQTRTKKPGLLDRLLGLDKPKSSARRVTADQNIPQRSNGIPGLFPGFLKSKSQGNVSSQATQPQRTASQQPPALVVKKQPKAPRFDDLDNAFPEESEAEADAALDGDFSEPTLVEKKETPFSGLTLDEPAEFEKPVIKSASGTSEEPPALAPATTVEAETAPELPVETAEKPAEEPKQEEKQDSVDAKMQKLAQRDTLGGLKGFCPVTLRDRRDLIDSTDEFSSKFEGKTYHFSSAENKASFDADPAKYAPVKGGNDVIVLAEGNVELEGTLDHAVWFKDRLYLFSSSATLETFVGNPTKYSKQATGESTSDDDSKVEDSEDSKEEAAEEPEAESADDPFAEDAALEEADQE